MMGGSVSEVRGRSFRSIGCGMDARWLGLRGVWGAGGETGEGCVGMCSNAGGAVLPSGSCLSSVLSGLALGAQEGGFCATPGVHAGYTLRAMA